MIYEASIKSIREIFKPRFRGVVWKSVGLTIMLFIFMWFGFEHLVSNWLLLFLPAWPWLTTAILFIFGAGLIVGAGFLLAPTTAIFAGLFIDEIAEHVEETHYSDDPPGKAVPLGQSAWLAIKFTILVIITNLIALVLVILPGINFAIFFFVNGYLLGREYFQFAAMRFMREEDANRLRKQHRWTVMIGGMVIAGLMSIPILNLFTPVFAACMMVHVFKGVTESAEVSPQKSFGRAEG